MGRRILIVAVSVFWLVMMGLLVGREMFRSGGETLSMELLERVWSDPQGRLLKIEIAGVTFVRKPDAG